jgi:hypothetical protein
MLNKSKLIALAALAFVVAGEARASELHVGNPMMDSILNGALADYRRYYGVGDPRCPRVRTSDRYGNYTGWVHTCALPPSIHNGVIEMHSRRLIVGDEDRR